MLHNAFAYVTRKFFKSIVIFLIILLMASLSLVGLSIKGATAKASQETFKNITNSFSMQSIVGSIKELHVVRGISRVKISKKLLRIRLLNPTSNGLMLSVI